MFVRVLHAIAPRSWPGSLASCRHQMHSVTGCFGFRGAGLSLVKLDLSVLSLIIIDRYAKIYLGLTLSPGLF